MADSTANRSGQEAEQSARAIDRLKSDLRSLRTDLETAAKTVNELGGSAAHEAMQQAQAQMEEIRARLESFLEDAQDYGNESVEAVRQHVQQRPFQSLLIAMAAGFALAHLVSRR